MPESKNLLESGVIYDNIEKLGGNANYADNKYVNNLGAIVNGAPTSGWHTFISSKIPVAYNDVVYWKFHNTNTALYLAVYDEGDEKLEAWM